jgi:RhtB (resistance to homoserine/threonine) family protein
MAEFFAITFLIMLAAISPGPDFVMVTKNALSHSRTAGIFTSLGVTCSLLFHASYCIMGLTLIISKSLLLFNIIKYIGAAYLIYIGLKSLFAKKTAAQIINKTNNTINHWRAFRQGFLCNALNPKAIMFFLALFTVVLKPSMLLIAKIGFALEIAFIHLIWFSLLSILITHPRTTAVLKKAQTTVTRVMGGVLVLLGLRIAALSQHAVEY